MPGLVRILAAVVVLALIPSAPVRASRAPVKVSSPSLVATPTASPIPPVEPTDCVGSTGVVEEGDTVIGTDGPDSIDCSGSPVAKTVLALGGGDTITGSGFADRIEGGDGKDILEGGAGADELDGGPGADTATFNSAEKGMRVDLAAGTGRGDGRDTLISIRDVVASRHPDVLLGSKGRNRMRGGRGADYLDGRDGGDTLKGGMGTDTLVGREGGDKIWGGRAIDACAGGPGKGKREDCEAMAIGEAESVVLFQPAETVIGVGFHESLFDTALELRPHGDPVLNANPAKYVLPEVGFDGLDYTVMGSRGRPTRATSSADVVVPSSSPVLSPVTGTVVELFQYVLYCRALDWELVIEPEGQPDVRVILLHFVAPAVIVGDRVVASVTRVGTSWTNDTAGAQQNDFFPDQYPHVHVEMVRGHEAPIPGCLPGDTD